MEAFEWITVLLVAIGSTLFGAWLEFRFGIILSRITREESQSESQSALVPQLIEEVSDNEKLLNLGYTENKYGNKMNLHTLFRDSYDNAKTSSGYSSFSAELITTLKYYYGGVDQWNDLVRRFDGEQVALTLQSLYNQQSQLETKLKNTTKALLTLLQRV